jgi:rhodanese-related sulfurtransferase
VHDALRQTWGAVPVRRDPECRVCGSGADATRALGWATAHAAADGDEDVEAMERVQAARPSVDVVELARLLDERASGGTGFVLLDVREPGERDVAAIPGSELVPVALVRDGVEVPGASGRVYVHCKSGGRSAEAVDLLRARGVDAIDVEGGILAWSRDVDPSVPLY